MVAPFEDACNMTGDESIDVTQLAASLSPATTNQPIALFPQAAASLLSPNASPLSKPHVDDDFFSYQTSPSPDLLLTDKSDDDPVSSLHDQSVVIGDLKNQLQSTEPDPVSHLPLMQTQLSSTKVAEIRTTQGEMRTEIVDSLHAKEETRGLPKRIIQTGQQAEAFEAGIDKLKEGAKQQKGLLVISDMSTNGSDVVDVNVCANGGVKAPHYYADGIVRPDDSAWDGTMDWENPGLVQIGTFEAVELLPGIDVIELDSGVSSLPPLPRQLFKGVRLQGIKLDRRQRSKTKTAVLPNMASAQIDCSTSHSHWKHPATRNTFGNVRRHLFRTYDIRVHVNLKAAENNELELMLSSLKSDIPTSSPLRQLPHPARCQEHSRKLCKHHHCSSFSGATGTQSDQSKSTHPISACSMPMSASAVARLECAKPVLSRFPKLRSFTGEVAGTMGDTVSVNRGAVVDYAYGKATQVVAQGFCQELGQFDESKSYVPVTKTTIIQLLLAWVTVRNLTNAPADGGASCVVVGTNSDDGMLTVGTNGGVFSMVAGMDGGASAVLGTNGGMSAVSTNGGAFSVVAGMDGGASAVLGTNGGMSIMASNGVEPWVISDGLLTDFVSFLASGNLPDPVLTTSLALEESEILWIHSVNNFPTTSIFLGDHSPGYGSFCSHDLSSIVLAHMLGVLSAMLGTTFSTATDTLCATIFKFVILFYIFRLATRILGFSTNACPFHRIIDLYSCSTPHYEFTAVESVKRELDRAYSAVSIEFISSPSMIIPNRGDTDTEEVNEVKK